MVATISNTSDIWAQMCACMCTYVNTHVHTYMHNLGERSRLVEKMRVRKYERGDREWV